MGDAIGGSLSYAFGVALSPIAVAGVLLMLLSRKATTNAPLFLLGWMLAVAVVGVVVLIVPGLEMSQGDASVASGVVRGVIGLVFIYLGVRGFRGRPRADETPPTPGWMQRIDELGGPASLGLGLLLAGLNPKNLLLVIGGAVTISSSPATDAEGFIALGVFVVVASLSILVPVAYYLVVGERAARTMRQTRDWLIRNNAAIMSVVLMLLAVSLIGDAIEILF